LPGDIEIMPGALLTIHDRVSMAPGSKITVHDRGNLILENCLLHNDCNQTWQGIEIIKKGKKSGQVFKSGNVELRNVMRYEP